MIGVADDLDTIEELAREALLSLQDFEVELSDHDVRNVLSALQALIGIENVAMGVSERMRKRFRVVEEEVN